MKGNIKKISILMGLLMGLSMSLCMSLCGTLLSGHFTVQSWLISFAVSFVISIIIGFIVPMKPLSDKVCQKFGAAPETAKAKIISALVSDIVYTPIMTFIMCYTMTSFAAMGIDKEAAALSAKIDNLTAQQASLSQTNQSLIAEHDELMAQADAKDRERAELEAQRDALTEEQEEMTALLETAKNDLSDLEDDIVKTDDAENSAQMTDKRDGLIANIKEMETAVGEMQNGIAEMEGGIAGLTEAAQSMRDGAKDQEKGIADQQNGLAEMQKGIDSMTEARSNMLAQKPVFIKEVWLSFAVCMVVGFVLAYFLQPLFLGMLMRKYSMSGNKRP
ncbi:MAG: hypothetical protein II936_00545 [Oscillospiraceae bacterium]|nr:hypothetical protein [Oscillospiraceae bacterium]